MPYGRPGRSDDVAESQVAEAPDVITTRYGYAVGFWYIFKRGTTVRVSVMPLASPLGILNPAI